MNLKDQICTFQLGQNLWAVPISRIREITGSQTLVTIPRTPAAVAGLINLRGQVLTAVDLRPFLGLKPLENRKEAYHLVLEIENRLLSLLLEAIGDITEWEKEKIEETPPSLPPEVRKFSRGVVRKKDTLILLLEIERLKKLKVEPVSPHSLTRNNHFPK